jgi:hypothetical protein
VIRFVVLLVGVLSVLVLLLVLVVSWDERFSCTVKCRRGYISARARAVLGDSAPTWLFVSSQVWTSGNSMLCR